MCYVFNELISRDISRAKIKGIGILRYQGRENSKKEVVIDVLCIYNCELFFSDLPDVSLEAAESAKRVYEEGQISCLVVNLVEVKLCIVPSYLFKFVMSLSVSRLI